MFKLKLDDEERMEKKFTFPLFFLLYFTQSKGVLR